MEINWDEVKEYGIYDFVANYYWEMTKEQLASFCKEIAYASYEDNRENYAHIENSAIEVLMEDDI